MYKYKLIIKPKRKLYLFNLEELWSYKELALVFCWRNIKIRYKQTFLGVFWVILQPITTTVIFTVFFGRIAKIPSDNLPYELFVFIGLIFWTYFSSSLISASNSTVENINMIKKVYFPREILPVSAVITSTFDFAINFILLMFVVFYYGYKPALLSLIIIPLCLIVIFLTSTGLALFLSSLNLKYRDVRFALPFFVQTLLFLTPVIYPLASTRDSVRLFMAINPLSGVIESSRAILTGNLNINYPILAISFISSVVIFFLGLVYFRMTEKYFADIS